MTFLSFALVLSLLLFSLSLFSRLRSTAERHERWHPWIPRRRGVVKLDWESYGPDHYWLIIGEEGDGSGAGERGEGERGKEVDYSGHSLAQLKDACRQRGLKVSGKKGELIERLLQHSGRSDDKGDGDERGVA